MHLLGEYSLTDGAQELIHQPLCTHYRWRHLEFVMETASSVDNLAAQEELRILQHLFQRDLAIFIGVGQLNEVL